LSSGTVFVVAMIERFPKSLSSSRISLLTGFDSPRLLSGNNVEAGSSESLNSEGIDSSELLVEESILFSRKELILKERLNERLRLVNKIN
jgi:hypothetical protein